MTTASVEAYQKIVGKLTEKRLIMFGFIEGVGSFGSTIQESMEGLGWPHTTASARIFELAEAGLIRESGKERHGQTVWVLTPPEMVEHHRALRAARKKYEASPCFVNPTEKEGVLVSFMVPDSVYANLKKPVRVRFL